MTEAMPLPMPVETPVITTVFMPRTPMLTLSTCNGVDDVNREGQVSYMVENTKGRLVAAASDLLDAGGRLPHCCNRFDRLIAAR